jgi:hypothetical protein
VDRRVVKTPPGPPQSSNQSFVISPPGFFPTSRFGVVPVCLPLAEFKLEACRGGGAPKSIFNFLLV